MLVLLDFFVKKMEFIELENLKFEHISSSRENEFLEFKFGFKDEFAEFWIDFGVFQVL